jgi:hypothetical protein
LSRLIYAMQVVVTRKNGWMMLFKNGTLLNYTMGENAGPPTVPLIVEGVTQLAVSQRGDPIQMLVRFANGSLLVRSKPWVQIVVVVFRWFVCLSQPPTNLFRHPGSQRECNAHGRICRFRACYRTAKQWTLLQKRTCCKGMGP